MRIKKVIFIACVIIFCMYGLSFGAEDPWKEIVNGTYGRILCIKMIEGIDTVYVGTEKGLFKSTDSGKKWSKISIPSNISCVNDIALKGNNIYLLSGNILYKGKEEKNRFKKIKTPVPHEKIYNIECNSQILLVAAGGSVWSSDNKERSWKKVFTQQSINNGDIEEEYAEEEIQPLPAIRDIDIDEAGSITIATPRSVLIIPPDERSRIDIGTEGIPSGKIRFIEKADHNIFLGTSDAVFVYSDIENIWQPILDKTVPGDMSFIESGTDFNGRNVLFIAIDDRLYKHKIKTINGHAEWLNNMRICPTIKEVQMMAVEYAEVSPEKIKNWRNGAKWKALLPKLSVGFSEDSDDNVEIYTSSTKSYHYSAPREVDHSWDVDLTWDLSELVWNTEQTSIDTRSKLMVQLRDEILEEVTRLYFERKRIISEIKGSEEVSDHKRIRVEELTAYIDAYTGGKFSNKIEE